MKMRCVKHVQLKLLYTIPMFRFVRLKPISSVYITYAQAICMHANEVLLPSARWDSHSKSLCVLYFASLVINDAIVLYVNHAFIACCG